MAPTNPLPLVVRAPVLTVRDNENRLHYVTPAWCECNDMLFRGYAGHSCKHLTGFYADRLRISLAVLTGATGAVMLSETTRGVEYRITLWNCSTCGNGLTADGGMDLCEHIQAALPYSGWFETSDETTADTGGDAVELRVPDPRSDDTPADPKLAQVG